MGLLLLLGLIFLGAWLYFRFSGHAASSAPPQAGAKIQAEGKRIPAPIADRVGHIGGIESITLDGVRWYFGFDFGSDLVLSPLIDDADVMADFASRYMSQRDGTYDAAYWRQLVDTSVAYSDLSSQEGSRDFFRTELSEISSDLRIAMEQNRRIEDFVISDHLRYLLGAACAWSPPAKDGAYLEAEKRLRLTDDGMNAYENDDRVIGILDGEEALPQGAAYSDAGLILRSHLDHYLHCAPANWKDVFSDLSRQS